MSSKEELRKIITMCSRREEIMEKSKEIRITMTKEITGIIKIMAEELMNKLIRIYTIHHPKMPLHIPIGKTQSQETRKFSMYLHPTPNKTTISTLNINQEEGPICPSSNPKIVTSMIAGTKTQMKADLKILNKIEDMKNMNPDRNKV